MLELSFLRQYRSRLAFLGGCLILTWIGACATLVSNPSKSERFRRYDARFSRVTPAGKVILQDGTAFKLAGIEMRSVAETEEPTLLRVVNDIIRDSGRRVEIELDSVSGEAVVYYRQRIHYRDNYGIRWVRLLWVPEFSRRSVNELLIVMAAARYATLAEDGRMTKKATTACKVAQDKAQLALHSKWRHRALSEYMHGGGCQLYSNHDEYKARITKGDVASRDSNLLEIERERASVTSLVNGPKRVAALLGLLSSDNRIVRRFAMRELVHATIDTDARNAIIGVLDDEDRLVREYAQRALGR